ncbi:MAG: hypothetical protein AAGB48_10610 [Planctomycetota bacterium]
MNDYNAAEGLDFFGDSRESKGKREVILSLYSAMISIGQEIRKSVERVTVWGSGIVLLAVGWIARADQDTIDETQRFALSGCVLVFAIAQIAFIRSLWGRYRQIMVCVRRINELQGGHQPGVFLHERALFPKAWLDFGTDRWREAVFRNAYLSIGVVTAIGVVLIWVLAP